MKRVALVVSFLAVAFLAVNPHNLLAQTGGTGIVVGTVTDPTGAAVPGATVTLTDTATNAARTAITNDTGRYNFPNVPPGNYNITISKAGFRVTKIVNENVAVAESRTLDVRLEIGTTTQSVEVVATNTELQTLNATIGNTVSGNTLSSLPSLGRDVSSFVTMQPGVSPDGSVGGTVVDQANFMLDGGNNSNDMDGSGGVYNPSFGDDPTGGLFSNVNNPISGSSAGINAKQPSGVRPTPLDSVEEFKVATSNQTADFNASSGMEVQIVTKRGTNAWHGTAYEYYLDNTMSGNLWQNNSSATPVPDWHRSWFGVAVGGPVIPKEILGGKTYFFFNYQGARFPFKETYDRLVPSTDMVNGILHDPSTGATYNLNTLDPRTCGTGPCGINTYVQQMWKNHMPPPTPGAGCGPFTGDGICDGVNTLDFRSNLAIPQNDNFAVVRLDHDFGAKWHFMSSYRYYHLTSATDDQVDIGGSLKGDTLGTPASLTNHPQVPWYLVVGMTTNITTNVTNDFRYSFLRNFWQWGSAGDPAQFSNLGAALEPFGETTHGKETLAPYNVNTQQTRTRFWDGKDNFIRDDVSWLKGTHFFQFGGQYQHNWNYHTRTDNGAGINYYPVYQLGNAAGVGGGLVDFSLLGPAFAAGAPNAGTLDREAAAVLGIVTQTQQAFTRSGSNLQLNGPLIPAFDKVSIPYYNLYFGDSWRVKPSITLNYGLGWSLEMPPVEDNGKQVILVDANDKKISTEDYLNARKAAALAGQVYNPEIGFALINNVAGHPKYPFNPFYHGFSPRIAVAWNPDLGPALGGKNTVIRGGYGRIYGRVNGVNLVLTPLLSPGIIQAAGCTNVLNYTNTLGDGKASCNPAVTPNLNTAFRIGTDGTSAPLVPASSPISQTLPQPYYPGIGGNAPAITASPLDPNFKPNSVDSIDISIQRQFTPRISIEVGAISRWIHNELQNMNVESVPYMMTKGGQQFAAAYAAVEKAMGCATSVTACNAATVGSTLTNLKSQQFFEAALAGTGYCAPGTCTATVVAKEFGNFQTQSVWNLWSDLDKGGSAPGFNFPFSMLNTNGQMASSSYILMSTSLGHGNYNAGFITLKMNDWHGVTVQNNFTYSKALGTGAVIQATSSETAVDPYHLNTQYGLQPFDRKFVDTLFLVYRPPYYSSQQGLLGHVLGGWTFSPIFTAGSGAPDFCNTNTGLFGEGYSGGQDWGSADGATAWSTANCILTNRTGAGAGVHYINGVPNMFANPAAAFANVRPPILGLDGNIGGFGQFRGLTYWNMNLGAKKNVRITERVNVEASFNFINVLNHNQFLDPTLNIAGQNPNTFGQLSTEGTNPRTMEFGIRVNF